MKTEFQELRASLASLQQDMTEKLMRLSDYLRSNPADNCLLVDLGYLCRVMSESADELRKELNARKDLIGKIICANFLRDPDIVSGDHVSDTVQGTLATGILQLGMLTIPPTKDTKEYSELLAFLGVPETARAIKLDWKELQVYMNELAEQGKPVPTSVVKQLPDHKVQFNKIRGKQK